MNLYFTVEFRRCLDLLSASIGLGTCSSLICNASVQFQMKIRRISRCRSRSPKYPELGHFTLLLCRGRRGNVQRIGHFRITFSLFLKASLGAHLSYENEIPFTCKLNSFSYEWLFTWPRFEREALGNSEMVYL